MLTLYLVGVTYTNNLKDLEDKALDYAKMEHKDFFRILISKGFLRSIDPSILDLEFYTPALMIYLRILSFEKDIDTMTKNMVLFENHVNHFRETYFIKR